MTTAAPSQASYRSPRIPFPDTGGSGSSAIVQPSQGMATAAPSQAFHPGHRIHFPACENDARIAKRSKKSARISNFQKLPVQIVEKILQSLDQANFRKAIATAFLFLRAGLSTCCCEDIQGREGKLIAALVESKNGGYLRVAWPVQTRSPWLESAAVMLKKYLTLAYQPRRWVRAVSCRDGTLAVIRDHGATVIEILKPFDTLRITKLLVPESEAVNLVSVGIEPLSDGEYRLLMFFRGVNKLLVLKIYQSTAQCWELKDLISPFSLSPKQKIRPVAVYSSGNFHVLDHISKKILTFNSDLIDEISLPVDEVQNPITLQNSTLACTRGGELTWVVLDGNVVNFFVYNGSTWVQRWRRRVPDTIPQHFNTCELIGHSEKSAQVIFRCAEQIFAMDVEGGTISTMKDCGAGTNRCLCIEIWHALADHHT